MFPYSIDRIETNKPTGMRMSGITDVEDHPLRKKVTLTWHPALHHVGRHNIGFRAVDIQG